MPTSLLRPGGTRQSTDNGENDCILQTLSLQWKSLGISFVRSLVLREHYYNSPFLVHGLGSWDLELGLSCGFGTY